MVESLQSAPTAITEDGDSGALVMQYQDEKQLNNSSEVLVYRMVLGIYTDSINGRIVGTKMVVNRLFDVLQYWSNDFIHDNREAVDFTRFA